MAKTPKGSSRGASITPTMAGPRVAGTVSFGGPAYQRPQSIAGLNQTGTAILNSGTRATLGRERDNLRASAYNDNTKAFLAATRRNRTGR
jgi:hypothetical protein